MTTTTRLEALRKMIDDSTLTELLHTYSIPGMSANTHLGFVGDSYIEVSLEEITDAVGTELTYELEGWVEWYEWRADENHEKTLYTVKLTFDSDGDQIPGLTFAQPL